MKKKLFLALISLFLFASCGNDDVKPTPDPTFPIAEGETNWMVLNTDKAEGDTMRLYITVAEADKANVWIDLNGNGQKEEGEAVSALNSFKEYIINSSTIAVYGKITKLNCSGNNLTDLDVSNNTALENLICHGNEISTLDLSKNKALTELACTDNKLSTLDLSNNNALKGLNCSRNELTSINISGANALKYIYMYGNKITDAKEMQNIVDNLPAYAEPSNGEAVIKIVIDQKSKENKISESQADAAKAKKWTVVDSQYNDYEGEDELPNHIYKLTFTTAKEKGETLRLLIDAATINHPHIWIDLNNNGTKDEGEDVTLAGPGNNQGKYTIDSQTITVYGKINRFQCYNLNLTSLDVSNSLGLKVLSCQTHPLLSSLDVSKNTALKKLAVAKTKISTLDLSKNTALETLSCWRNEITSINISGANALKEIELYGNKITDEQAMQHIVDNLPDLTTNDKSGSLWLVETQYSQENKISKNQIDIAIAKNWKVQDFNSNDYEPTPLGEGETNWMKLITEKAENEKINLVIDVAEEADKAGVWIDLNLNGKKDGGEDVSSFNSPKEYVIKSKTIMVYGKITKFNCAENKLTKLDAEYNKALLELNIDKNNLINLDLSKNKDIKELSCSDNKLTNLNLRANKALENLNCVNNELGAVFLSGDKNLKSLSIYNNKITRKDLVNDIIRCLPDHAESTHGESIFKVVKTQTSKENTISKDQVGTARKKKWKVVDSDGNDYAGE